MKLNTYLFLHSFLLFQLINIFAKFIVASKALKRKKKKKEKNVTYRKDEKRHRL